jgi:hypothetical protein
VLGNSEYAPVVEARKSTRWDDTANVIAIVIAIVIVGGHLPYQETTPAVLKRQEEPTMQQCLSMLG